MAEWMPRHPRALSAKFIHRLFGHGARKSIGASKQARPFGGEGGYLGIVVFTPLMSGFVVMAADSAVTNEFGTSREYQTGRKSYFFKGLGCITTRGARDHNKIGPFLARHIHLLRYTTFAPWRI